LGRRAATSCIGLWSPKRRIVLFSPRSVLPDFSRVSGKNCQCCARPGSVDNRLVAPALINIAHDPAAFEHSSDNLCEPSKPVADRIVWPQYGQPASELRLDQLARAEKPGRALADRDIDRHCSGALNNAASARRSPSTKGARSASPAAFPEMRSSRATRAANGG